jgi:hypothetical protein
METASRPEKRGARYPVSVLLDDHYLDRLTTISIAMPGKSQSEILRYGIDLVWQKVRA